MRRSLTAAAAVVVLSGALGPSLRPACDARVRHACCASDAEALGGMERPPCCAAGKVRAGPVAPAVLPERRAQVPILVARVTPGSLWYLLDAESPALVSRAPGLAHAQGPPLRLRI